MVRQVPAQRAEPIDKAPADAHVPGKVHLSEGRCQPPGALRIGSMVVLASLRRAKGRRAAALAAYGRIIERARDPAFYLAAEVPDSFDGRFELLALHAFLVLHRLKREHAASAIFAQELFDTMFADLDRTLREMGAGDLGVGPRIKAMARGFYGRIAAYERGLADEPALAAALRRNLYGTAPAASEGAVAMMARYVQRQAAALAALPLATLLDGGVAFAATDLP